MDRWLGKRPALLHIKYGTWAVFNKSCEPILWTDDAKEAAWYFRQIQPAQPARTRKNKYKRLPYGLPPKWRREELARIAEAHRGATAGSLHKGQAPLLNCSATAVVESRTSIARALLGK